MTSRTGPGMSSMSPHAWGWTGNDVALLIETGDVPTRVGMVRGWPMGQTVRRRSPHTRGDGPAKYDTSVPGSGCPHTRGDGPLKIIAIAKRKGVLPTRVGMVRRSSPLDVGTPPFSPHAWGWSVRDTSVGQIEYDSPHTRGDGPFSSSLSRSLRMFSPHAWGWSDLRRGRPKGREDSPHTRGDGPSLLSLEVCSGPILPTRVGMVRRRPACESSCCRCPHTRGDGPRAARATPFASLIVPTRVGMDGTPSSTAGGRHRCPHTRGDGPGRNDFMTFWDWMSPHAWGWTERRARVRARGRDVPTRVGMVRSGASPTRCAARCPHTRGDGPFGFENCTFELPMSPHAWGWTDAAGRLARGVGDVPTRVGMDRAVRSTTTP